MNLALMALLVLLAVSPVAAQNYSVTEIPLPPGCTGSTGQSVNAKDQATGELLLGPHKSQAFLFSNGTTTELGTLNGFTDSVGNAINDSGVVAGVATRIEQADHALTVHAFVAQDSSLRDLGAPDKTACVSSSINNSGQVVGETSGPDGQNHAFLYQNGKITALDDLIPANSGWQLQIADSINDAGDIVGSGLHQGAVHAFLYHSGQVTDLNQDMTGQTDWTLERAEGINSKGEIVSIGKHGESSHVFWYSQSRMTDLGALPDHPNLVEAHLNNAGQIVGRAETASGAQDCAFLYADGKLSDLNSLIPPSKHWSLQDANGINDKGVIVGTGEWEGKGRAFLLTPKAK